MSSPLIRGGITRYILSAWKHGKLLAISNRHFGKLLTDPNHQLEVVDYLKVTLPAGGTKVEDWHYQSVVIGGVKASCC